MTAGLASSALWSILLIGAAESRLRTIWSFRQARFSVPIRRTTWSRLPDFTGIRPHPTHAVRFRLGLVIPHALAASITTHWQLAANFRMCFNQIQTGRGRSA